MGYVGIIWYIFGVYRDYRACWRILGLVLGVQDLGFGV